MSYPRIHTVRNRLAFTLIELLVVVSIIALLVSILLPALGRARAISRTAVCLTNEKQQALAMYMYVSDNKDSYAQSFHHNASTSIDNTAVYDRLEVYGPEQPGQDVASPEGLWVCPADKPAQDYPDTYPPNGWANTYYSEKWEQYVYISYAYHTANDTGGMAAFDQGYGLYSFVYDRSRKSGQLSAPSEVLMFHCGSLTRTIAYWIPGGYDTGEPLEPFHPGGSGAINIVACDGHAESFKDFEPHQGALRRDDPFRWFIRKMGVARVMVSGGKIEGYCDNSRQCDTAAFENNVTFEYSICSAPQAKRNRTVSRPTHILFTTVSPLARKPRVRWLINYAIKSFPAMNSKPGCLNLSSSAVRTISQKLSCFFPPRNGTMDCSPRKRKTYGLTPSLVPRPFLSMPGFLSA